MPAPMVDCVFLLLVFFAAGTLDRPTEGVLKAFLPRNRFGPGVGTCRLGSDVRVKLLWCDPASLRPTDDPARGVTVLKVGAKVYDLGEHRPDYEALFDDLLDFRDAYRGDGSLSVIIDGRGPVPFHHVVSVLNVCRKARITDVSFAAPERPY